MQIVTGFLTLGVLAALCACFLHGAANTLESISWWFYCQAVTLRAMHARRTRIVQQRWRGEGHDDRLL